MFLLIRRIQPLDLFTNPIFISKIVKEEKLFLQTLSVASQDNPIYLNLLNKYLKKNTLESLIGTQSQEKNEEEEAFGIEKLVANPLHIFSLFYRLFILLPSIAKELNEMKDDPGPPQATKDFIISPRINDISQDDLVGVTFALIRIQRVYELDTYDMAMGRLGTRQTNARLSAEELYEIVKILYYGSDRTIIGLGIEYALTITWLEGTIRLSVEDNLQKKFIEEIKMLLLEIQDKHDKHFQKPWAGQNRAHVTDEHEGTINSYDRTQSSAWLDDEEYPNLQKISKYFATVTQLSISASIKDFLTVESENYQIGLYSPGGVYLPHMDTFNMHQAFLNSNNDYVGNRIATLMLYLSNVDGGGTAFTDIGKVAYPRKGSSVFWFNLFSDGEIDINLTHGACPTMYGVKWVLNKWIRSYGQIFRQTLSSTKKSKNEII
ncbi:P4HA [Lepeophtheirus salmonis]|uniref:procollagen-proline 4-dioxygenase n=1 Tax=Lepeophtheirus salmonis TaxID=72036 RepID=A0A7R8CTV6_LEPSM|nr:P4HA [Lepeophtheirus salmonis]CAF2929690.1 P4HA [Lepeophtheirus salmonis]